MKTIIKIILIVSVVIILFVGVFLVYLSYKEQQGKETVFSSIFPNNSKGENNTNNNNDIIILPEDNNTSNVIDNSERSRMFNISQKPVVGYTLISDGNNTIVRYMVRGTGSVYDYNFTSGNNIKVSNKTITRVQKIIWGEGGNAFITRVLTEDDNIVNTYYSLKNLKSAIFFILSTLAPGDNNKDVRILQKALNNDPETFVATSGVGSLDRETTYYGVKTIDAVKRFQTKYSDDVLDPQAYTEATGIFDETTRQKLNSLFGKKDISANDLAIETQLFEKPILENITEITSSPGGSKIFYLKEGGDKRVVGILANFDNTQQKEIFTSSFTDWNILWDDNNNILFTTKPSGGVVGYAYTLNTINYKFNKVIDGVLGLTIKGNMNSSIILYSKSLNKRNSIDTHVFDVKTQSQEVLTLATLPEKCVWSTTQNDIIYCGVPKEFPVGEYPDDWYKGVLSFSDTIWEYNIKTRTQNIIADQEESTLVNAIDVYNISMNTGGDYLFFIDKGNLNLFGISLN